ncbi:MAG: hypothetical protein ABIN94_03870 [Ferruginibacter sp.]
MLLIFFKKNLTAYLFSYLLVYLSINFIFESIAHYQDYRHISTYEVYNYEMIFEVSFFLSLYRKSFSTLKYKKLAAIFLVFFLIFAVVNIFFFQPHNTFNSNTYTFGCILLLLTVIIYLFNDIVKTEDINPLFFPMFWISLGVLFCYLVNFPFLGNVNQLFEIDRQMAENLSIMNYTVNILLYVLIGIGIICKKQRI